MSEEQEKTGETRNVECEDTATRERVDEDSFTESAQRVITISPLRVFCAVELPQDVRARAAEHIARLREEMPNVRASWDKPEKMHVTLKFLGGIKESRVGSLTQAAARAARSAGSFELAVEDAGTFPPRGPARVLWLGITDTSGALTRLQTLLEDECEASGFPRESRPYHPHLTIARLRQPQGARELAALHKEMGFERTEFTVSDLIVLRSELGPGGSRYTEIARHSLG